MLVTLLTDFGTADYYAGAMRGAVLAVNPEARVFDITHEIPPQDVEAAAFTLLAAYDTFPPGTVHVAVVDPGVGSARRPLVVVTERHRFVGPDNGLFTYVCEREPAHQIFRLTNSKYFRDEVSATFHGRDVFAPTAGALTLGVSAEELGEPIDDAVRLETLAPKVTAGGSVEGRVIHVDRFGNLVTNVTRREFSEEEFGRGARLFVDGREIKSLRRFYAERAGGEAGEAFAIWGSAGFLEISVNKDSAARLLGATRGRPVLITTPKAGG